MSRYRRGARTWDAASSRHAALQRRARALGWSLTPEAKLRWTLAMDDETRRGLTYNDANALITYEETERRTP